MNLFTEIAYDILEVVKMTALFLVEVADKTLQVAGCIAVTSAIVILGHLEQPIALKHFFPPELWNSPDFQVAIILFAVTYIATTINRIK